MRPFIDRKARHNARKHILQALYQWQLTQVNIVEIEQQFHQIYLGKRVDTVYFQALLHAIPTKVHELDQAIAQQLTRPLPDVDPIELAILRLATFELLCRIEIPYQAVINEALELAKTFGSKESYRFVNGVLDKVARLLRPIEFSISFNPSLEHSDVI